MAREFCELGGLFMTESDLSTLDELAVIRGAVKEIEKLIIKNKRLTKKTDHLREEMVNNTRRLTTLLLSFQGRKRKRLGKRLLIDALKAKRDPPLIEVEDSSDSDDDLLREGQDTVPATNQQPSDSDNDDVIICEVKHTPDLLRQRIMREILNTEQQIMKPGNDVSDLGKESSRKGSSISLSTGTSSVKRNYVNLEVVTRNAAKFDLQDTSVKNYTNAVGSKRSFLQANDGNTKIISSSKIVNDNGEENTLSKGIDITSSLDLLSTGSTKRDMNKTVERVENSGSEVLNSRTGSQMAHLIALKSNGGEPCTKRKIQKNVGLYKNSKVSSFVTSAKSKTILCGSVDKDSIPNSEEIHENMSNKTRTTDKVTKNLSDSKTIQEENATRFHQNEPPTKVRILQNKPSNGGGLLSLTQSSRNSKVISTLRSELGNKHFDEKIKKATEENNAFIPNVSENLFKTLDTLRAPENIGNDNVVGNGNAVQIDLENSLLKKTVTSNQAKTNPYLHSEVSKNSGSFALENTKSSNKEYDDNKDEDSPLYEESEEEEEEEKKMEDDKKQKQQVMAAKFDDQSDDDNVDYHVYGEDDDEDYHVYGENDDDEDYHVYGEDDGVDYHVYGDEEEEEEEEEEEKMMEGDKKEKRQVMVAKFDDQSAADDDADYHIYGDDDVDVDYHVYDDNSEDDYEEDVTGGAGDTLFVPPIYSNNIKTTETPSTDVLNCVQRLCSNHTSVVQPAVLPGSSKQNETSVKSLGSSLKGATNSASYVCTKSLSSEITAGSKGLLNVSANSSMSTTNTRNITGHVNTLDSLLMRALNVGNTSGNSTGLMNSLDNLLMGALNIDAKSSLSARGTKPPNASGNTADSLNSLNDLLIGALNVDALSALSASGSVPPNTNTARSSNSLGGLLMGALNVDAKSSLSANNTRPPNATGSLNSLGALLMGALNVDSKSSLSANVTRPPNATGSLNSLESLLRDTAMRSVNPLESLLMGSLNLASSVGMSSNNAVKTIIPPSTNGTGNSNTYHP